MPEQTLGDFTILTDFIRGKKAGSQSRFSYVQHQVGRRIYMVPCMGGLDLEEACSLLAERVERDHPGEGNKAFESAREQLTIKDFDLEWEELQHKIRMYKKWGGHMPSIVIVPDELDPKSWNTIIPDRQGNPWVYRTPDKFVKDLLPPPTRETTYKRNGGYYVRPDKRRRN